MEGKAHIARSCYSIMLLDHVTWAHILTYQRCYPICSKYQSHSLSVHLMDRTTLVYIYIYIFFHLSINILGPGSFRHWRRSSPLPWDRTSVFQILKFVVNSLPIFCPSSFHQKSGLSKIHPLLHLFFMYFRDLRKPVKLEQV